MLNKDMIAVFLEGTKLSEVSMPEHIHDILLACDIEGGWCAQVNKICAQLTDEHKTCFYRSLLLAWLLDIDKFGPVSWGWYKAHENDSWHLLTITHAFTVEPGAPYTVCGTHFSPDNMLLFLEDKAEYKELLSTCINVCKEFSDNYRPYKHNDIPLDIQIDFIYNLDEKIKMVENIFKTYKE